MKSYQMGADKFSITLSVVCAFHCLILPVLITLAPTLAALNLDDERFHFWMVVAVLPISVYGLTLGCKKHKRYQLLFLGFVGLSLLISALLLEDQLDVLNSSVINKKSMTLLGAIFLATGHWLNYRLCLRNDCN